MACPFWQKYQGLIEPCPVRLDKPLIVHSFMVNNLGGGASAPLAPPPPHYYTLGHEENVPCNCSCLDTQILMAELYVTFSSQKVSHLYLYNLCHFGYPTCIDYLRL